MIHYREPLFRPPAEADSLIFQVAYGCPHNRCRFCGMYKTVRYAPRPPEEVWQEFVSGARRYPAARRIFLADGDVMFLPFERLQRYLQNLNELFPQLARVGIYANASSILKYSEAELRQLRQSKLHTLYIGLESGDQQLLDRVGKTESAEGMVQAVRRAQQSGLRCSVMILLGLGGTEYSAGHAIRTAAVLNRMQPRLLSALRFVELPDQTPFDRFQALSEYQVIEELQTLVSRLELHQTVFRANHSSNPVPLEGRFPAGQPALLRQLDRLLSSGRLDRHGPGRLPLFL